MSVKHEANPKVVKSTQTSTTTRRAASANVVRTDNLPAVTKVTQDVKATNTKIRGLDVDTSRFIYHEVPSIDGTRKILTIANAYVSGLIEIFRDGVEFKKVTDYAETDSTTITLDEAIDADETFWVHYIKAV